MEQGEYDTTTIGKQQKISAVLGIAIAEGNFVLDEMTKEGDEKKSFSIEEFCVYIGRCWQHRKE